MDRFLATAINWPQINDTPVINDAALSFSSSQPRCLALFICLSPLPVVPPPEARGSFGATSKHKANVALACGEDEPLALPARPDQVSSLPHFPCLGCRKSLSSPPCPHLCNLTLQGRAPTPSAQLTVTPQTILPPIHTRQFSLHVFHCSFRSHTPRPVVHVTACLQFKATRATPADALAHFPPS